MAGSLPLRATDVSQVSAGLFGRSLRELGVRGRRLVKAQGLGPMPCRAACRLTALKMRVPLSRALVRLPVADEAAVGGFGLTGEFELRLAQRLVGAPDAGLALAPRGSGDEL